MHPLIPPCFGSPAIERGVSRSAERRSPPPAHQPLADEIVDREEIPRRPRGGDDLSDPIGKLRRHPLVGIDFEDPVAAAEIDPSVPPPPLALPGALDQPVRKVPSNLARAITAPVEHDDDLVRKTET